jgi:glutamate-5-semialdehyde dehydrogenase
VPVIQHYRGVCHLYLDASAPAERSVALAVDGKSRPSACNSTETLLVHVDAAERLLPRVGAALRAADVELRADERALGIFTRAAVDAVAAHDEDFGAEFLDRILAVRVVDCLDAALEHIQTHGSLHTEAICTDDLGTALRFQREVDASCVLVNASTRFNDGGELGLGAEIGISTSKLHAFGPMGLRELTTTRFVVMGEGQVRG